MDLAQCFGSASSYARKYALNGLFLIDDTKDSDAQPPKEKPKPQPKTLSPEQFKKAMQSDISGLEATIKAIEAGKFTCTNDQLTTLKSTLEHKTNKVFEDVKDQQVNKQKAMMPNPK